MISSLANYGNIRMFENDSHYALPAGGVVGIVLANCGVTVSSCAFFGNFQVGLIDSIDGNVFSVPVHDKQFISELMPSGEWAWGTFMLDVTYYSGMVDDFGFESYVEFLIDCILATEFYFAQDDGVYFASGSMGSPYDGNSEWVMFEIDALSGCFHKGSWANSNISEAWLAEKWAESREVIDVETPLATKLEGLFGGAVPLPYLHNGNGLQFPTAVNLSWSLRVYDFDAQESMHPIFESVDDDTLEAGMFW